MFVRINFIVVLLFFGRVSYSQEDSSVIHQQKAIREIVGESLNDFIHDAVRLTNNGGTIRLTRDSLIFKCKDKRIPQKFDFALSVCEIVSIENYLYAGFMPNRIRITIKGKIIQLGTFKRRKLIRLTRKQMELCRKNDVSG